MAHNELKAEQKPVKKVFGPAEFKPLGSVETLTEGPSGGSIDGSFGGIGGFGGPLIT